MAKSEAEIYVANQSGSAEVDGEVITFVKDVTRIRKGHAILKQLPNFFDADDKAPHYDTEEASTATRGTRTAK